MLVKKTALIFFRNIFTHLKAAMSQAKQPTEYDLLEVFVNEMESRGENL